MIKVPTLPRRPDAATSPPIGWPTHTADDPPTTQAHPGTQPNAGTQPQTGAGLVPAATDETERGNLIARHPWILLLMAAVVASAIVAFALVRRGRLLDHSPHGDAVLVAASSIPSIATDAAAPRSPSSSGIPVAKPLADRGPDSAPARTEPGARAGERESSAEAPRSAGTGLIASQIGRARRALRSGDHHTARALYGALTDKAKEIIAGHARASASLGDGPVLNQLAKLAWAYSDLRRLLEVRMLLSKGHVRAASRAYRRLPRRIRRRAEARLYGAWIDAERGKLRRAHRAYRRLVKRRLLADPQLHLEALIGYSEVLLHRKYLTAALAMAHKARRFAGRELTDAPASLDQRIQRQETRAATALRRWHAGHR